LLQAGAPGHPWLRGDFVYYTAAASTADGGVCTVLQRVPFAGGETETIVTSTLVTYAFGPTDLYVGTFDGLFKVPLL
jgi:hypothetical protein